MTNSFLDVSCRLLEECERLGHTFGSFIDAQYVVTGVRSENADEATLAAIGAKTSLAQCDAEASADEMRVPYPLALSDDTRRLLAASFRALAVDLERDVPEKLGPAGYAFVKKFLGTEEG